MLIYIIRHGETDFNTVGKLQGWLDIPLNENGKELAVITGNSLAGVHFDICYTSPSCRAAETARLFLEASGNNTTEIIPDNRLREMNFGTSDGFCCMEDNYTLPLPKAAWHLFFYEPFNFPGFDKGEDFQTLCARSKAFMEELLRKPELQDKTVLLSSHGCTIRALLNPYYDDSQDFWQGTVSGNCAINIIEVMDGVCKFLEKDKLYYDISKCVNRYEVK